MARDVEINSMTPRETIEESPVTSTLIRNAELIVIGNVPARVDSETGEQLFAPATVEKLQNIIWGDRRPKRIIRTPVYEFAG